MKQTERERIAGLIEHIAEKVDELDNRFSKIDNLSRDRGKGTRGECIGYAIDLDMTQADGQQFFDTMESNGWAKNNGKNKVKDWKATMRVWKTQGWIGGREAKLPGSKVTI